MRAFPESRSWIALVPALVALAAFVPWLGWSAPKNRLQKVAAEAYFDADKGERWRYLVNLPENNDPELYEWLLGRRRDSEP
ncbi:MAG: hypothetical protein WD342_17815 [Verrucomicrobiales bacterium]